jgi:hypothetical protein
MCSFSDLSLAFDPAATANHCSKEQSTQRHVNNTEHTHPLFSESDLDREISVAIDETVRAIERIHHPHARFIEAMLSINGLFGKDPIVRKLMRESIDDQLIRHAIGLSNWLYIIIVVFLFDFEWSIVVFENRSTGLTRKLDRNSQLLFVVFSDLTN